LDGGSHVEDASDGSSNLKDEERDKSDSGEGAGESHPSIHVAAWGNASHKKFPGHGSVLDEGLSSGYLFGILGCEVSGLLELLAVSELRRLVQESLKAGTEGLDLFIFLLRGNLDGALGGGEFGLLRGKFKGEAEGLFIERGDLYFDGSLILAVGKHDGSDNGGINLFGLFSTVATHGG
jgi:hypothetical protein